MDNRSIQRLLRDTDDYELMSILNGLSGEARRKIFMNVSRANAENLAKGIYEDKDFAITGGWALKHTKESACKFLQLIDKLEKSAEIVFCKEPDTSFLSIILQQLNQDEKNKKVQKDKCDMMIKLLQGYRRCTFGEW